jgi:hypothetical protein
MNEGYLCQLSSLYAWTSFANFFHLAAHAATPQPASFHLSILHQGKCGTYQELRWGNPPAE